jgi:hypothetical protein
MAWLEADLGMAGEPGERRTRRWARRSAALALAALAQGGLLWLTAVQQRTVPFPAAETSGLPVWIAPPSVLTAPRRPAAPPLSRARAAAGRSSPAPALAASPPSTSSRGAAPTVPPGPAPGPSAPGVPGGVASALRGSLFGCANVAALGLSDAERIGCRDRLAAGAATAAYRPGIPAAKGEYYAAVLAAEADYRKTGGHPPMVVCFGHRALPHAIRIGPCSIDPPQGSLDPDVDVPEMEPQRDANPPPR